MKTTLKRAMGRAMPTRAGSHPAESHPLGPRVLFEGAAPRGRTRLQRAVRVLAGLTLTLLALVVGVAGGAYLWFDRAVAAIQTDSPALARAASSLRYRCLGGLAIALLLGIDTRAGAQGGSENTDTMMLVRADPATHTISLLSFPRDLNVPIYCAGALVTHDRINAAYARCGPRGVLETVQHLTSLPVNYLITVDFHGFKEIVDRLGGIWSRRGPHLLQQEIVGTAATGLLEHQPAARLPAFELGRGARVRALPAHRLRPLPSSAREQEFIRAVKEEVAQNFDP